MPCQTLHHKKTLCFPGATVKDIITNIHNIIESHPSVQTIIIHVYTNDINEQQSEILKQDFIKLFNHINKD